MRMIALLGWITMKPDANNVKKMVCFWLEPLRMNLLNSHQMIFGSNLSKKNQDNALFSSSVFIAVNLNHLFQWIMFTINISRQ